MSLTSFVNANLNKQLDNGQGGYRGECVSLAIRTVHDVYSVPYGTLYCSKTEGARDLYEQFDGTIPKYFTRIKNDPNDYDLLPQAGDLIVWGSSMGNYGHVGVVVQADPLKVFQQLGTPVFKKSEIYAYPNYNGVLGWLRPKVTQTGARKLVNQKDLDAIYELGPLESKRARGEGEDVYLNKTAEFVLRDHAKSKRAKDKAAAEKAKADNLHKQISTLQSALKNVVSADDYHKAQEAARAAQDKNAELQLKLDSTQSAPVQNEDPVKRIVDAIKEIINKLRGK